MSDNFVLTTPWPEPEPVFYRLYHDDRGQPLFYSMEDVPGTYIEIDQPTYARSSMWVRVVDGRLVDVQWRTASKLVPADTGQLCHARDVCIVASQQPGQHWRPNTDEHS